MGQSPSFPAQETRTAYLPPNKNTVVPLSTESLLSQIKGQGYVELPAGSMMGVGIYRQPDAQSGRKEPFRQGPDILTTTTDEIIAIPEGTSIQNDISPLSPNQMKFIPITRKGAGIMDEVRIADKILSDAVDNELRKRALEKGIDNLKDAAADVELVKSAISHVKEKHIGIVNAVDLQKRRIEEEKRIASIKVGESLGYIGGKTGVRPETVSYLSLSVPIDKPIIQQQDFAI